MPLYRFTIPVIKVQVLGQDLTFDECHIPEMDPPAICVSVQGKDAYSALIQLENAIEDLASKG